MSFFSVTVDPRYLKELKEFKMIYLQCVIYPISSYYHIFCLKFIEMESPCLRPDFTVTGSDLNVDHDFHNAD
jgi:hypothetical protein